MSLLGLPPLLAPPCSKQIITQQLESEHIGGQPRCHSLIQGVRVCCAMYNIKVVFLDLLHCEDKDWVLSVLWAVQTWLRLVLSSWAGFECNSAPFPAKEILQPVDRAYPLVLCTHRTTILQRCIFAYVHLVRDTLWTCGEAPPVHEWLIGGWCRHCSPRTPCCCHHRSPCRLQRQDYSSNMAHLVQVCRCSHHHPPVNSRIWYLGLVCLDQAIQANCF